MPRTKRIDIRDYCYHLINRANGRQTIFLNDDDYLLFETVLETAQNKFDVQIFAYTIMQIIFIWWFSLIVMGN